MFRVVVTLPILLLCGFYSCKSQDVNFPCQTDSDCNAWLACVNNICTACARIGSVCQNSSEYLAECCPNTSCEYIPGLKNTLCVPNKNSCSTNKDCIPSLQCLKSVNKCGLCRSNGEKCSTPYDNLECCSNYCKVDDKFGNSMCTDLQNSLDSVVVPPFHNINKYKYDILNSTSDTLDTRKTSVVNKRGNWPLHLHTRVIKSQVITVPKRSSKICTVTYNCEHKDCLTSKCPGCTPLHMTCSEDMLH
jgi:hypothetical protein